MHVLGRTDRRAMPAVRLPDRLAHRRPDDRGTRRGDRPLVWGTRPGPALEGDVASSRPALRDGRGAVLRAAVRRADSHGLRRQFAALAFDDAGFAASAAATASRRGCSWRVPLANAGRSFPAGAARARPG